MADTKQKGDIAEQAVVLKTLKMGWSVSLPVGDRMSYDLIIDVNGVLVKIQVKYAWYQVSSDKYFVNTRKIKTNRKNCKIERYKNSDFDFAIGYIADLDIFYVIPVEFFISCKSSVNFIEPSNKRQRTPRSAPYKEAWHLITEFAENKLPKIETPESLP